MELKDLGYNIQLEQYRRENNLESFEVGRIVSEHKERYVVKTNESELNAELIGNLRFSAEDRNDFPAAGDWVAITEYDEQNALIHAIYPRSSVLERQTVGKFGQKQIIATNVDFGLIVQAVDRDFNLNRLERYLTICHAAHLQPVIILSKTDLIDSASLITLEKSILERIKAVEIISISTQVENGCDKLASLIKPGKTYCLLGSSGVGKSTLVNSLTNKKTMKTGSISSSVNKGKHVTSHRELIVLDNGGIIIDNPGMKEVGIVDESDGLGTTFNNIVSLSENCKFNDCTHENESGCAILEALENGDIEREAYQNFQKLEREKSHFESSIEIRRKKDKDLGKMIKSALKNKRNSKY